MNEAFVVCESCGSVVRRDEIRRSCSVCGRKTYIACFRICDLCLRIVCPDCIKSREIRFMHNWYLKNVCDACKKLMV